jgi:hypothetical protein
MKSDRKTARAIAASAARQIEALERRVLLSTQIFAEGFEGAFPGSNWSVNVSQSRTWDDTNYKAQSGSWSGFCAEYQGNDATNTYVNNLDTYMERTVNLSGYTAAYLSFYYWENSESGVDYFRIKANGTELFNRSGDRRSWNTNTIDLSSYAGQSNVTIRFEFTSDSSTVPSGDAGVWLDDISLTGDAVPSDPNDQISEAQYLGAPTPSASLSAAGTIDAGTDVDMFSFDVTSGQRVAVDIDQASSSGLGDSYIRVFNNSGTQLASNDDGTAPGEASSTDSYLEYTFASAGRFYVGVSGYSNTGYDPTGGGGDSAGSTGAYTIVVSDVPTPDPNDQISEAQYLGTPTPSIPVSASGTIDAGTDVDMFSFEVSSGQRMAIDIDKASSGGLGDSYIRLFNSSGTQLASNDDGAAPGESSSNDSYLEYTFSSGGRFYVGVSGYNNSGYDPISGGGDASGSTGAYTILVSVVTPSDPDDQTSEARSISVGSSASDGITPGTDVDMYSFTVTAGQKIGFDIDKASSGGLGDSYIRLFNSSGTVLASNDDAAAPGESGTGYDSYLEYTFSSGGTYYLGVSGYGNSSYNAVDGSSDSNSSSTGGYTLVLTNISGGAAGDPDDQITEATALGSLTPTLSVSGLIDGSASFGVDMDMYSFTATAGQRVAIDIDKASSGGLGDSYIRLFNSSGNQLSSNDDGAAPGEISSYDSYLEYTISGTGTYYVGVSGYSNTAYNPVTGEGDRTGSTGAYIISLSLVSANPSHIALTTTTLSDAESNIHDWWPFSDGSRDGRVSPSAVDFDDTYTFVAGLNGQASVQVSPRGSDNPDLIVEVYDWRGVRINTTDSVRGGGAETAHFSVVSGRAYYVLVDGYGQTSGDYRLTVSIETVSNPLGSIGDVTGVFDALKTFTVNTPQAYLVEQVTNLATQYGWDSTQTLAVRAAAQRFDSLAGSLGVLGKVLSKVALGVTIGDVLARFTTSGYRVEAWTRLWYEGLDLGASWVGATVGAAIGTAITPLVGSVIGGFLGTWTTSYVITNAFDAFARDVIVDLGTTIFGYGA